MAETYLRSRSILVSSGRQLSTAPVGLTDHPASTEKSLMLQPGRKGGQAAKPCLLLAFFSGGSNILISVSLFLVSYQGGKEDPEARAGRLLACSSHGQTKYSCLFSHLIQKASFYSLAKESVLCGQLSLNPKGTHPFSIGIPPPYRP